MAWKFRGNRPYYYQSERVGDRVVSRYFGAGAFASAVSQLAEIDRSHRLDAREERRIRKADRKRRSERFEAITRILTVAAEAGLESLGYHRHHRGRMEATAYHERDQTGDGCEDRAAECGPGVFAGGQREGEPGERPGPLRAGAERG